MVIKKEILNDFYLSTFPMWTGQSVEKTIFKYFRGRFHLQSVPSLKTLQWSVFKFTPCKCASKARNFDVCGRRPKALPSAEGMQSRICKLLKKFDQNFYI